MFCILTSLQDPRSIDVSMVMYIIVSKEGVSEEQRLRVDMDLLH